MPLKKHTEISKHVRLAPAVIGIAATVVGALICMPSGNSTTETIAAKNPAHTAPYPGGPRA